MSSDGIAFESVQARLGASCGPLRGGVMKMREQPATSGATKSRAAGPGPRRSPIRSTATRSPKICSMRASRSSLAATL